MTSHLTKARVVPRREHRSRVRLRRSTQVLSGNRTELRSVPQCNYIVVTFRSLVTLIMSKTRIVRIGNSQGVRIPKPLLEQAGLEGEVQLYAEEGRIVIAAIRQVRAGWATAAQAMHARGEDHLLDAPTATRFDSEEWEWE